MAGQPAAICVIYILPPNVNKFMKTLCTLLAATLLVGCAKPKDHAAEIARLRADVVRLEAGLETALKLIGEMNTNHYRLGNQQTTALLSVAGDLADLRMFVLTNSATQSEVVPENGARRVVMMC